MSQVSYRKENRYNLPSHREDSIVPSYGLSRISM
nr:MAG TPA: hypothetical protein [Caudoviricetes sp.]